jgi:hypothetical protein
MDCRGSILYRFELYFQFQELDRVGSTNRLVGSLTTDYLGRHTIPPVDSIGDFVIWVIDRKDDSIYSNFFHNVSQELGVIIAPEQLEEMWERSTRL